MWYVCDVECQYRSVMRRSNTEWDLYEKVAKPDFWNNLEFIPNVVAC